MNKFEKMVIAMLSVIIMLVISKDDGSVLKEAMRVLEEVKEWSRSVEDKKL